MNNILRYLFPLLACFLVHTSLAAAQVPPTPAPVPEIPFVAQGRAAPFDGFLVRGPDLAQWRGRIELLEHQLTLDVTTEQRIAAIQIQLEQARTEAVTARLTLRERLWTEQATALTRDLAAARKDAVRGFWESPTLWFAVGVLVTAALSVSLVAL
jgi:hypothetical protein